MAENFDLYIRIKNIINPAIYNLPRFTVSKDTTLRSISSVRTVPLRVLKLQPIFLSVDGGHTVSFLYFTHCMLAPLFGLVSCNREPRLMKRVDLHMVD